MRHSQPWAAASTSWSQGALAEFVIDETFAVPGVGTVVAGTVKKGILTPNMTLMLGAPRRFRAQARAWGAWRGPWAQARARARAGNAFSAAARLSPNLCPEP